MGPDTNIGTRCRKICIVLGLTLLLTALDGVTVREVRANPQNQADRRSTSSELLVIQGRITGIQGTLLTVKAPNGYPGEKGGHGQFVTAGPTFRVDISHARVLLPDGKQADKLPLVTGDHVLMVLTGANPGSTQPGVSQTYSALIVERVVQGDKIITH